jgi:uncharacterized protein (TIRG00374 family)
MASATDEKPVTGRTVKPLKVVRLLLPVLLGLGAIAWLFADEFDLAVFSGFRLPFSGIAFTVLAFLLMFLRDLAQMGRFRLLSRRQLSWRQSFVVNILSEFTSVATPTVVGGSSLVIFFLNKEGINTGRSAAIMLVNLLLDGLFFIVLCPLLFLIFPLRELFPPSSRIAAFGFLFAGLYALQLVWLIVLFLITFVCPDSVEKILLLLFKLPLIRRWRGKIASVTGNLIAASSEIKHCPFVFWVKLSVLTLLAWSARFLVVNAIFAALIPVSNHGVIYARQIILWVFMAVMPTPGSSGISEFAFREYYSDVCSSGSIVVLVTLIWRMTSHYLYLLLGMLILPRWLQEAFTAKGVRQKRKSGRQAKIK